MCCGAAAAFTACSDTWDDHYDSLGNSGIVHEGSLWQAIKSNSELSNFASVVEACDFAKSLDGSQVFTVFAPTNANFSTQQAQELIADYRQQVADSVLEDDNTVLKEFIHNHVALYNHSVSTKSNDSIVLMNGKYAVLTSNDIDGVALKSKNQLYGNGVLYTLDNQIGYLANVFEYIRKEPGLDSLRSFLYSGDARISGRSYPKYYYKQFVPEQSVAGSIVNGKTQYLDSVFIQRNELFSTLGQLNTEDSTYMMVAPTNQVWKQLIEEYEPYFNYPDGITDRDSMVYTNSRLAIVQGTTFSRTYNSDAVLKDSAMSVNSVKEYARRKNTWGANFHYYEYLKPLEPKGVLSQTDIQRCSNGDVRKVDEWNFDKLMTFHRYRIIEAEGRNSVKEVSKYEDSHGDSLTTVSPVTRYVTSDNSFYGKVWGNSFVEFVPDVTTVNHSVTFYLRDVLSNIPYDIYLVTVPALANDSNATETQRLPTRFKCSLWTPGKGTEKLINPKDPEGTLEDFVTTPDTIDYMLLAENYKFERCTYDVENEDRQALLQIDTRVGASDIRKGLFTRTLRIDCILLVPHGSLAVVDELPDGTEYPGKPGILMFPHGLYNDRAFRWWYMLR